MHPLTLRTPATLHLVRRDAERLGLRVMPLQLAKAWPRGHDHLLLEYRSASGETVAGQWREDVEETHRAIAETIERSGLSSVVAVAVSRGALMLQTHGADRRLAGLAEFVRRSDATLVRHRPERRAVVRLDLGQRVGYVKVVRPSRIDDLVARHVAVANLVDDTAAVPTLEEVDRHAGAATFTALPGRSLAGMIDEPDVLSQVGRALRVLHETACDEALPRHDADDEADVLEQWIERARVFLGDGPFDERVVHRLRAGPRAPDGLIHRDFFDKQVHVDDAAGVGFLDLDTAAQGERALDVANFLVHLELRSLQLHLTRERLESCARAFLAGYAPGTRTRERLADFADGTRLRLVCVYGFRPASADVVCELRERIGTPAPGTADCAPQLRNSAYQSTSNRAQKRNVPS